MRSTITVSTRSLVGCALVLIALLAAYFLGAAQPGARASIGNSPVQTAQDTTTEQPKIVMTGKGEATGVPDQLAFDVTISVTRPDVTTALDETNQVARRVLDALDQQGVDSGAVQTTGLSVNPVYRYIGGQEVLEGYAATERLGVLIKTLHGAGKALSATAAAGGNAVRIEGVRLQIGDKGALLEKARKNAVAEATAKAKQYATATGADLGRPISIREVAARQYVPVPLAADAMRTVAGVSKVPIRAGTSETSVTVAITWALG